MELPASPDATEADVGQRLARSHKPGTPGAAPGSASSLTVMHPDDLADERARRHRQARARLTEHGRIAYLHATDREEHHLNEIRAALATGLIADADAESMILDVRATQTRRQQGRAA